MKDTILSHLPPAHPWGQRLYWYEEVTSTNTIAKTMAAAGAAEGTVILADRQTAGRGRLGRSFCSNAGGIYMSVILRPQCAPAELMHLTCAVGVAVCDAVEHSISLRPGIKWINDLVLEHKKLGGILTELSIDQATGLVNYAVVGIGINCNQQALDFPAELKEIACSAAMVTGTSIDRSLLAAELILSLEEMNQNLRAGRASIMERYRKDCVTLGQHITVIRSDSRQNGVALDISDDGSLIVRFDDGHTAAVNSGEVSVRGLFGYV